MAASLWRDRPYTFRALRATYGTLYVRCDMCRRYAPLPLGGILDVDYRPVTFSCSRCGAQAWLCVTSPASEAGTSDYKLDPVEDPKRHPEAVRRLSGELEVAPRLGPKHYGLKRPPR